MLKHIVVFIVLVGGFATPMAYADTPTTLKDARADRAEYSPYLDDTYPDEVFFGDTHLHASQGSVSG